MELDVASDHTEVGNYFIANYPPFSVWEASQVASAHTVLDASGGDSNGHAAPLGLYLHIPFCRQRCKFCYFKVFTEKNAADVETYLDALARETELYAERAAIRGRALEFVYFGGGTPSFLSSEQLQRLVDRIAKNFAWDDAREVTFECEPGTFRKSKLETVKDIGTTRLSLGIEHFDDEVLTLNGRGHKSADVFRAYDIARDVGFSHLNIDLIAGLLGDSPDKWKKTVETALELGPDSVTIYQLELPHNSVFARETRTTGESVSFTDPNTKRQWVDDAFRRFEDAGYVVSSAYTVAKPSHDGAKADFVYRDSLWHGADMLGMGVASFSYLAGVHFQNHTEWQDYVDALGRDELPLARALCSTEHQRLVRELILQLKLGRVDAGYFREKFSTELTETFAGPIQSLIADGFAETDGDVLRLTRDGLLRADGLLPRFFEPEFRSIRYT